MEEQQIEREKREDEEQIIDLLKLDPVKGQLNPIDFNHLNLQTGLYYLKWKSLRPTRIKHQRCLIPLRRITTVRAVAVPVAPSPADSSPSPAESAEYRKKLTESYGFKQIGEPLPENVTLKDIVATLPKKVFEIDDVKAWKSVLISVTSYALGLFMISKAPWLSEDTAWHPVWREEFDSSPVLRNAIIYGYGPLRPWMSIAHCPTSCISVFDVYVKFNIIKHANRLMWHFDVKKFRPNEVKRVKISLACVIAFMAIGWPLIIYKTGIMGWIKFWLMPWLGYHFWMSTFTMVHHTAPHIPFKYSDEWNAAEAQLNGTVHCDYPRWIEILCHHINVHIPHHISPRIPSYNLHSAHQSLRENWGKYLNEATWNWRLMKTILTTCHVYNKEQNYIAFDELAPEESYPITILKKVMPDYA
ncbi:hypothetical protein TEA_027255 [Camellia sinensis var. sinensis]|uniref:Fatty acid desaturase domain-containing protein n=1 Tax=Camellia sinensis var. sinensis TaxID=542762 RepID=A0A4S4ENT2_CAMSN|nr:hypothetical protein TEA_027255 [Camellia sinensis var. sinensis]